MDRGSVGSTRVMATYLRGGVFNVPLPGIERGANLINRIGVQLDTNPNQPALAREITGLITEVGGAIVAGRVSLTPFDAPPSGVTRNTFCTSSGRYRFRNVASGRYVVTATGIAGALRSKSIHVDTEL